TALHEIGHYLAEQTGLARSGVNRQGALLRAEALADGFAVAWAVAKGGDPETCVRDVGVYRACMVSIPPTALSRYWSPPPKSGSRGAGRPALVGSSTRSIGRGRDTCRPAS